MACSYFNTKVWQSQSANCAWGMYPYGDGSVLHTVVIWLILRAVTGQPRKMMYDPTLYCLSVWSILGCKRTVVCSQGPSRFHLAGSKSWFLLSIFAWSDWPWMKTSSFLSPDNHETFVWQFRLPSPRSKVETTLCATYLYCILCFIFIYWLIYLFVSVLISFGAQSICLKFSHVYFTPTFSRTDGLGWDEPLVAEASRRIAPSSSEPLDAPVLGVYRQYIIVCYNQPQIEFQDAEWNLHLCIYIHIYHGSPGLFLKWSICLNITICYWFHATCGMFSLTSKICSIYIYVLLSSHPKVANEANLRK